MSVQSKLFPKVFADEFWLDFETGSFDGIWTVSAFK